MMDKTVKKIEERLAGTDSINEQNKQELVDLMSTLKREIAKLSETKAEHAESITGFVEVSAHEAMRTEKNQQLLDLSLEGLSSSVKDFETSHPKLAEAVNSFCVMLSNLGI